LIEKENEMNEAELKALEWLLIFVASNVRPKSSKDAWVRQALPIVRTFYDKQKEEFENNLTLIENQTGR
jgi:hypothetical protein